MFSLFTSSDSEVLPSFLRARLARWGGVRLLRFCWLRAAGREAELGCEYRLLADELAGIAALSTLVPVIAALRQVFSGLSGVGQLCSLVQEWFSASCGGGRTAAGEAAQAWLDWAFLQKGLLPVQRLMRSVVFRLGGERGLKAARAGSRTCATSKPDTALSDEAKKRRLGQRHLVGALAAWLLERMREWHLKRHAEPPAAAPVYSSAAPAYSPVEAAAYSVCAKTA